MKWYVENKLHRLDGPAMILPHTHTQTYWWVNNSVIVIY
jgi:hypothetical protein